MDTLIVFGVDTVAGSQMAQSLTEHFHIVGLCDHHAPEIPHCEIISGAAVGQQLDQLLTDLRPARVLDASTAGDSCWNPNAQIGSDEQCQQSLELAKLCAEKNISHTLLSSDAVLTGPWMFHEEEAEANCCSVVGQRMLALENDVLSVSPKSLVVRTHLFGWNLAQPEEGWIETLLERMLQGDSCSDLRQPGFATPLVATELANILERAFAENLTGLYHIAGSERVNRVQFARRLAQAFDITWLGPEKPTTHYTENERTRFGCGESSLQTIAIRRELCLAMPTLTESMCRLQGQSTVIPFPLPQSPTSRAA